MTNGPLELLHAEEVELPLHEDTPDREERIYERARNQTIQALGLVQESLRKLRQQRAEINAEIKLLVQEEDLLERMSKVKKPTKAPARTS